MRHAVAGKPAEEQPEGAVPTTMPKPAAAQHNAAHNAANAQDAKSTPQLSDPELQWAFRKTSGDTVDPMAERGAANAILQRLQGGGRTRDRCGEQPPAIFQQLARENVSAEQSGLNASQEILDVSFCSFLNDTSGENDFVFDDGGGGFSPRAGGRSA